jgi:predicted  nucleic acid-binding Zn-ribbon protein
MVEFLTTVAPGIAALLIAISGRIAQAAKEKQRDQVAVEIQQKADQAKEKTEQAALTMRDTLALYESTVRELRARERDLTDKIEKAAKHARDNSDLIHDLNNKINTCEHKSAEMEDKIRLLQATKAALNTQVAALILELENLTSAIKARGIKIAVEQPNI